MKKQTFEKIIFGGVECPKNSDFYIPTKERKWTHKVRKQVGNSKNFLRQIYKIFVTFRSFYKAIIHIK